MRVKSIGSTECFDSLRQTLKSKPMQCVVDEFFDSLEVNPQQPMNRRGHRWKYIYTCERTLQATNGVLNVTVSGWRDDGEECWRMSGYFRLWGNPNSEKIGLAKSVVNEFENSRLELLKKLPSVTASVYQKTNIAVSEVADLLEDVVRKLP